MFRKVVEIIKIKIPHEKTSKIPKYLKINVWYNAIFAVRSIERVNVGHKSGLNNSTVTYFGQSNHRFLEISQLEHQPKASIWEAF